MARLFLGTSRFLAVTRGALALVTLGAAGEVRADIPGVELAARVTPVEVTVGDLVRYEITVAHPAGARIVLPAVRGNTGTLEVLAYDTHTDSSNAARRTVTHVLTLAAYETGADTLPPQRVEVRFPPDTTAQVLYTPPTVLTVKVTAPGDTGPIADIHDEERLPRGFPWALPFALAALAAAVWGLRTWRARRAATLAARPVPPPPAPTAAEAALARLDTLERCVTSEDSESAEKLKARSFAFTLSEILREYLAARYDIEALEATTTELLDRTAALSLTAAQHAWLQEACAALDAVKFADAPLARGDRLRLLTETRTLVHATTGRSGEPVNAGEART